MFDVIVIGGNLAGTAAAINAAAKGVNVALIERNEEPFFPAHCGEGIDNVTIESFNLDKIDFAKNWIKNIVVNIMTKEYTYEIKKNVLLIFDRNSVEKGLLKKAEKQGVNLILGTSMSGFNPPYDILLDNKKVIKGKVVIDASGTACQVGRRIGMDTKLKPEDIGVSIQSRVQSDFTADTMKLWFHRPYAPFGYAWLFPLNEKMANIGLGVMGGQKIEIDKLLKNYINDMTSGKYKISSTFRACVPLTSPLERLIKDNVMIVGDAARLSNPLTGGGIRNALFSGSLAGMIAGKYIRGEISSLEPYQDAMRNIVSTIRKFYIRKKKIETDQKFVRAYRRAFTALWLSNKLAPNLFQGRIIKTLEKDKFILESYR